jgi:hypothetical protein
MVVEDRLECEVLPEPTSIENGLSVAVAEAFSVVRKNGYGRGSAKDWVVIKKEPNLVACLCYVGLRGARWCYIQDPAAVDASALQHVLKMGTSFRTAAPWGELRGE